MTDLGDFSHTHRDRVKNDEKERFELTHFEDKMMPMEKILELLEVQVTQLDASNTVAFLKEDLNQYETIAIQKNDISDAQLANLLQVSGHDLKELLDQVKSLPVSRQELPLSLEGKNLEELINIEKELALYYDKLLILQEKMTSKLDGLVKERDELFVKCELSLEKLE